MRRWITKLAVATSLVVWLLVVSMWVRSYWVADYFFFDPAGKNELQVVTTRGQVHVQDWAGRVIISGGGDLPDYEPIGKLSHLAMRPAIDSSRFLLDEDQTLWERAGFRYEYLSGYGYPHCNAWQCPLWFLCVMAGVLPARAAHSKARAWQRRAKGLCLFCGYDRRATTGLCPGCGKEPAAC